MLQFRAWSLVAALGGLLLLTSCAIGPTPATPGAQDAEAAGPLFDVVVQFFTEDDWPVEILEEGAILRTRIAGSNEQFNCYAQTIEDQFRFVFYSVRPTNVPEDRRTAVAEFLTRANYGLIIGNFELDFSDGEVRYKTSIDVEGARLTPALIKQMVYANVMTMDEYLPGIAAVVEGTRTPVEAIREIEK